jgi:hypothetical protein
MVDMRGTMTRSMYSVTCSGDMLGFWTARYIVAKVMPVPLTMLGSSASEGSWLRTCWTFDITSVSALSGSEPSCMLTVTTDADGRDWVVT